MDYLLDFLNRFWIDGVVCVAYGLSLYAVYLIRINRYKIDRDWVIFRTQLQAKEVVIKAKELNELAKWLNQAVEEVTNKRHINFAIRAELEEKNRLVKEIHAENLLMLANNRETLKENKFQVYQVREATLILYRKYKEMAGLMRHLMLVDDGSNEKYLRNALNIVNEGVKRTSDYFQTYFRMTPAQYMEQKEHLTGKKSNGSDHVTDFSVN